MELLASWLQSINGWWVLASAILCILIDWALLQTEAFLTLGIALIPVATMLALDINTNFIIWSFPFFLIVSYFGQRRIFMVSGTNSPKPSFEIGSENLVGKSGILSVIKSKDMGRSFYYQGNTSLIDPGQDEPETVQFRVVLSDGTIHPAVLEPGTTMNDGTPVRIVGLRNGALKVESLEGR